MKSLLMISHSLGQSKAILSRTNHSESEPAADADAAVDLRNEGELTAARLR